MRNRPVASLVLSLYCTRTMFLHFFLFCSVLTVVAIFSICLFKKKDVKKRSASVMVIVGSGGHTKEILTLVKSLGQQYHPRHYIIANTDKMSEEKVHLLEESKTHAKKSESKQYEIHLIPRSREVLQSWFSTIISTAYAILYSIPLVFKIKPDIILCNGPGTCIPVCLIGFLLKILKISSLRIVYVESICRVETLSLSGKILYYIADNMLVQWPELQEKYPRTQYIGRIV